MHSRNSIASILTACVLAVCYLAVPLASESASAAKSAKKSRDGARAYVLESKRGYRRSRTQRIYLPIGPSYTYYDYPYYYSRGHYPTHIGGYVYYYPKFRDRCVRGCGSNWRGLESSGRKRGDCGCR